MSEQTAVDSIVSTLRSERRRRGLSQTDGARLIGRKTYQTLYQWERGINTPSLANLRFIEAMPATSAISCSGITSRPPRSYATES